MHFAILASLDREITLIDNDCIKKIIYIHSLVIRSTGLLKNLVQFRCNSVLFPISGLRCTLGTRSCARPARRLYDAWRIDASPCGWRRTRREFQKDFFPSVDSVDPQILSRKLLCARYAMTALSPVRLVAFLV